MPCQPRRNAARASLCRRLAFGLALAAAASSPAPAAKIPTTYSPSADELGKATVLDQSGRTVPLRRGVLPTYIVYRLDGSDKLPAGLPTLAVRPGQARGALGPLRLDATTQTALNAALASNGQAAVLTPRQTFLVQSLASASASAATATPALAAQTAPSIAAAVDRANAAIQHPLVNGVSAFRRWSDEIRSTMRTRLALRSPQAVDHKLAAPMIAATTAAPQVLIPPVATAEQVLAAPVPEPASLLVFAAGAVAACIRLRRRS